MLNAHRHVPAMLLAAVVGFATPACVTGVYASQGFYSQAFERRAFDNGRREGLEQGRDDARSRRAFSFARHDEYRDGDNGYRGRDGSRDVYRQAFRRGYQSGYTEAFNQFARTFPRTAGRNIPGTYLSYASENGYRDGFEEGRKDADDRRAFDPTDSSRYRSGDRNYDRRYGSRDDYRRQYQPAFLRGYEDGFGVYRRTRR